MTHNITELADLVPEQRERELRRIIKELQDDIAQRQEELEKAQRLLELTLQEEVEQKEIENNPVVLIEQKTKQHIEPQKQFLTIESKTEIQSTEKTFAQNEELERLLANAPPTRVEVHAKAAHAIEEAYKERTAYEIREEQRYERQHHYEKQTKEEQVVRRKAKHLQTAVEQIMTSYNSTRENYE